MPEGTGKAVPGKQVSHWLVQIILADHIWYQALGCLGHIDRGPDCENLMKEVVASMGFELVGLHMEGMLQVSC